MGWAKLETGLPDGFPRPMQRAKLYADEDIEDEIVHALRSVGVNIKGARELRGHRGKPDEFHAAYAFRERRFLITKNGKHFMDDRRMPLNRTHGVIVLEGNLGSTDAYIESLQTLFHVIVPYGELYQRSKISLSRRELTIRYLDHRGQRRSDRFKISRGDVYVWEDDSG
jgi:Domain of unknown function (DUF5615)